MPKIFYGGGKIISDDIFTIEDDDFDIGKPLQVLELPEEEFDEEELRGEHMPSPEDTVPLEGTRREAEALIESAKEEAAAIVNKAVIQAQLDHDHMLEQTAQEMERVKQQAYAEAYQRGMTEGAQTQVESLRDMMAQVRRQVADLEGERAGFIAEYEYNMKWLAWEIASKVLGKKIEEDETELVSLVKMAVSSVKNAQWITVEVSEKATALLDALTKEFRRLGDDRMEVRGISAPDGTCIIDTPDGLIDASVYRQLENLRIYFANEEES